MRYFTALFDFDGTLADSADVSLASLNAVAPEFGFIPVAPEEVPVLRQMPARRLLTERAGIALWNIPKIRRLERRVRQELNRRAGDIGLFAGVPETLRKLRTAGIELGVVSSNSRAIVEAALERAGVAVDFVHAGSRFFGKASALRAACREFDVNPSLVVYVGDEVRDVEACKKIGIPMVAVGWGFNTPEALRASGVHVAATPNELFAMLTAH